MSVVWIEGQEKVPDELYTIYNQEIEVPYYNYNPKPEKKPEKIIFEKITSICFWDKNLKQKRDEAIKETTTDYRIY